MVVHRPEFNWPDCPKCGSGLVTYKLWPYPDDDSPRRAEFDCKSCLCKFSYDSKQFTEVKNRKEETQ